MPTSTFGVEVLRVPDWASEPWLWHGFSTRAGGVSRVGNGPRSEADLNLGFIKDDAIEAVAINRSRFLKGVARETFIDRAGYGLVTLKQMHSSVVRKVGRADVAERAAMWGDGMMTAEPGVLLGIQTADCLPILIADKKRRAVAAFHAGWRGTLKAIVGQGVASMVAEFGSAPDDLLAAIGPGIGSCCFEVGPEVRALFAGRFSYGEELFSASQRPHLDLVEANRRQLRTAGLSADAIFTFNDCTSCQTERFFSYRAEGGNTGRLMAVIGIAPE